MNTPSIAIILSSVRTKRAGETVARWVHTQLQSRTDVAVSLVDLKEWQLPNYAYPETPKTLEASYPDERARQWVTLVSSFDGYIIVTPEYNHGYPASLKNALDYVYAGWNRKPVAFVSYGGPAAGIRAVQQLRQVVVELQMVPLRAEVNIPLVSTAFDANGALTANTEIQQKKLQSLADQLVWWASVLRDARTSKPYPA